MQADEDGNGGVDGPDEPSVKLVRPEVKAQTEKLQQFGNTYTNDIDLWPGCYTVWASALDDGPPLWDFASATVTLQGGGVTVTANAADNCFSYGYRYSERKALHVGLDGCLVGEAAEAICPGSYGRQDESCSHWITPPPPTIPPTEIPEPTATP
jgi:hypothetical protein